MNRLNRRFRLVSFVSILVVAVAVVGGVMLGRSERRLNRIEVSLMRDRFLLVEDLDPALLRRPYWLRSYGRLGEYRSVGRQETIYAFRTTQCTCLGVQDTIFWPDVFACCRDGTDCSNAEWGPPVPPCMPW